MATYNVLDSIQRGMQFGQGVKANRLANALSGQLGQAGFDIGSSPEYQQLLAIDPKRAAAMQDSFSALSNERKGAFFKDMRKMKELIQAGEMGTAVKLLSDRHNDIKTLGGNTDDTDLLIDALNSGDMNRVNSLLDIADRAGVEEGFLSDPLDREMKRAAIASKKAAGKKTYAPSDADKKAITLKAKFQQLESAKASGNQAAISAAQRDYDDYRKILDIDEPSLAEKTDAAVDKANRVELAKQATEVSSAAFEQLPNIRSSIGNMTDAIAEIDRGAQTGPIISRLPSFRDSSIALDNIRGRMGLNVIGATTFGALSEAELKFALDTALPTSMEPKDLREWLVKKRDSQRKLGRELMKAAEFLGKPGNTVADYIKKETKAGRLAFDLEPKVDITTLSDDDLFK